MRSKILITGAAGYMYDSPLDSEVAVKSQWLTFLNRGGSIVADFLAGTTVLIKKEDIFAAVRSKEQAKALTNLGINVLQLDLTDETSVAENLLGHDSRKTSHPFPNALSKKKKASGEDTYFIHTDVTVIEHAKARGVTSFIVVPPIVYGRGSGQWNQVSVVIPVSIQASIAQKTVYKFAQNKIYSSVHISDLTALYGRIIEKILQKEEIPNGTEGYYFAVAHKLHQWEFLDKLAVALNARGLVTDTKIQLWPSDEAAAEALGFPQQFVQILWNSSDSIVSENKHRIGWKPTWTEDRFLQQIDDEIEDVLELGQAKSSLISSINGAAQG
ncbi:MAG: hypothetical protein Q9214_002786 [Letrouitia sp. 1 TL-2023]